MDDDIDISDIDLDGVPLAPKPPAPSKEDEELIAGIFDDEEVPEPTEAEDLPVEEAGEDDLNLDDLLGDTPPTVPELFPDWRDLFARRPFAQARTLEDGKLVLLLGFAFQEGDDGSLKLDNCRVGDVLFRDLVSVCAPFARSNSTDSKGVKIKVIEAVAGTRVRCWTNLKRGGERRDLFNTTLVVTEKGLVPAP